MILFISSSKACEFARSRGLQYAQPVQSVLERGGVPESEVHSARPALISANHHRLKLKIPGVNLPTNVLLIQAAVMLYSLDVEQSVPAS